MGNRVLSWTRIWAVSQNTFREAIRNRAFVGLMIFALAFILFSLVLSEMTVRGEGARVVLDFGFFAIGIFGVVTAIVMGAILLHKEVEKKTIYTILSKPVWRYEFVLGKYLGMLAILMVAICLLGGIWFCVLGFEGVNVGLEHVKGLVLIQMEVAVVTAVAVMFSSISSPIVTAMLSVGTFVVGRLVYLIEEMLGMSRGVFAESDVLRSFGESAVVVFPDLSVFNISQQVLLGIETDPSYIVSALMYALGYVGACLVVSALAFQRRDFI